METLNILLIEDDFADAELVGRMLKTGGGGFSVSRADKLSAALLLLDEEPFDVVLLDLNLPDSAGLDTLRKLQEKASRHVIIVLTGLNDERTGMRAVELGAQDYLVKGYFRADALHRAVLYAVGRKKVQQRMQKAEELSEARNRINDLISSTLDFEEIMNRAIGEAAGSISADAALIGQYDESGFIVKFSFGLSEDLQNATLPRNKFRALAAVEKSGAPIITSDALTDDRINPEVAKRYGVHAAIFFPLFVNGSVAGALAFFNLSSRVFDDLEIDSVRKISASLSLALENAQLYEECKLAEEGLKKKSRELEMSNRDLEQFASVASHDLQEPLLSLSSALKLGMKRLKDKADKETFQLLSDAMKGAENMQKMVRNLLAYSRVGRQPSFESVELEKVLDLALNNLKSIIEKSAATITRDPLPRLFVDPILFAQLFQNLVGNAIKYRSERRPEIHITAERRGEEYVFCVSDNGIGIPAEFRDAAFHIFRRIPGMRLQPGSGIGLATCKKIVELHGGRIWVDSEERKGSRFYVSIPVTPK